jgi:hypothetical protein
MLAIPTLIAAAVRCKPAHGDLITCKASQVNISVSTTAIFKVPERVHKSELFFTDLSHTFSFNFPF